MTLQTSFDLLHFVYALIFFAIALKIRQSYLKGGKKELLLKYFMLAFFFWGGFEVARAAPHISIVIGREDLFPQIMRWGYIISHAFLIPAAIYMAMIPARMFWPKYEKLIFGALFFWGVFNVVYLIITPFTPTYNPAGVSPHNPPPLSLVFLAPILFMGFTLTGLTFLYQAIRGKVTGILRIRALLLGIGIIMVIIGGPTHNFFTTVSGWFILDIISLTGKLLAAAGVILCKPRNSIPT
ncbi:MAG: hypothetical protein DRH33_01885 [Candidatus Nealsonbacteria bacterium]|nr:MAG: hypothetical protein DRH33_01885 [Candidatus Nealsonbacteria bacterium]